jgi:hypothetical protein
MKRYTNRFDAKRDANEPEIVKAFERRGISVYRLNQPLDLLLGYNKKNYLVEVKMPEKGLNDKQVKFVNDWKGQYFVCYTVDQADLFADKILNNHKE